MSIQLNYYEIGNIDNKVLSNSALNALDPQLGGSPKKFILFFDEEHTPDINKSMETGTLIHQFVDQEDKFAIADVAKPSDHSARWAEEVYRAYGSDPTDDQVINIKNIFKLHNSVKKEDTILTKFEKECWEYLQFLDKADGKVIMTEAMRDKVVNCYNAIKEHEAAYRLLFAPTEITGLQREKEKQLYVLDVKGYDAKGLIDCILIDHENKVIEINDLKTTHTNPYGFVPALGIKDTPFEYRKYYRQLAWYGKLIRTKYPDYIIKFNVIVVSTVTFECAVFQIAISWIKKGLGEIESLVERFKYHEENGYDHCMEEGKYDDRIIRSSEYVA